MQLLFYYLLRARPFLTQHGTLPRFIASKGTPRRLSTPTFGKAQAPTNEPQWSSGTDEATKKEALELISGGKWSLSTTRMGIEREFKFKTFAKAMAQILFINQIADQCEVKKHHPEWANVYNKIAIRWTTHNPEGLSYKDVEMAKFCDDKGTELGETERGK
ncbi:pterin 4 alpha carbinolamine dehydratase-domain-containing protein [Tuber borchii]|uniref:4a-hydroxytetrahydrobiopterin dehydratase n=1 Tax=Tuber borchii TaxID=42251 RepID=A0A2T6ZEM4_TUBBO|nr:pterin 4 alpha carbinolamine dehydratase-domain-containing protein [Tuber borchii]